MRFLGRSSLRSYSTARVRIAAPLALALSNLLVWSAYADAIPLKPEGGTFVVPVLINNKITLAFEGRDASSNATVRETARVPAARGRAR